MTPDYDRAATLAMETLIRNQVTGTPVDSLSILMRHPGVRVISFTNFATQAGIERRDLVPMFGGNQDAATFHLGTEIDDVRYVVVYNMRLPYEIIWRGIARELGHIVLGHDGQTRPSAVRLEEAMTFAHHLISPRPVLQMLREAFPLTINVLTDTTGCSDDCVDGLRQIPGTHVDPALNREVRKLFSKGIREYIRFHREQREDRSHVLDLGAYMEGYEE